MSVSVCYVFLEHWIIYLLVFDVGDIMVYLCWDSLENSVLEAFLVDNFSILPFNHNYLDSILSEENLLAISLQKRKKKGNIWRIKEIQSHNN